MAMSSLSLGLIMSEQRLRIKWPFKSLPSVVSLPDCCWSLLLLPGIDDWPSGELVMVVGENHWDTREVTRFKIDCNGEIKIHVNIPGLCLSGLQPTVDIKCRRAIFTRRISK